MKSAGSILISLVFLHALVIRPLLIECIQADGSYLMEIMGCDPCHGFFGAMKLNCEQDFAPATVASICSVADPCLDLFLDGPGGTRVTAHLTPLPPLAGNQTSCVHHPAFPAGSVAGASDPELNPPLPHRLHSQSVVKLRI